MVASAQKKFASEARLRSVFPFGNTELTCMPLSGHFMDIGGRVLVQHTCTDTKVSFSLWQYRADLYATIWTLYGHWGSGPSATDEEIPTQSNL